MGIGFWLGNISASVCIFLLCAVNYEESDPKERSKVAAVLGFLIWTLTFLSWARFESGQPQELKDLKVNGIYEVIQPPAGIIALRDQDDEIRFYGWKGEKQLTGAVKVIKKGDQIILVPYPPPLTTSKSTP